MPRGGHAHSGPARDPKSGRSERRGLTTTAVLPAGGYKGRVPGLNRYLPKPTARHRELWRELWSQPQAHIWINQPWRFPVVAELVRLMALSEQPKCAVGVWSAIRQRRDDLALSFAGMRQEGVEVIAGVSLGTTTSEEGEQTEPEDEVAQRRQKRRSQTLHEE